jgi:CD109 antigen
VAEYVLPKFQVTSSLPVYNTYTSGKMIFGVEAKYTYGKPVKGTVTVKIENQQYWWYYQIEANRPERYKIKTFPIDGKTTIELDLKKDLDITNGYYTQSKSFEITVLEELTGKLVISLIC